MRSLNNCRRKALILLTSTQVLALGSAAAYSKEEEWDRHDSRVKRGFVIAPVPLDLRAKNQALVGLGSYIVNAQGSCNDCHTAPSYAKGGDPFLGQFPVVNVAGYLAGGRPFGPGIVSKNITPDAVYGRPAGLTFEEFETVLRTGRDPDNPSHILQVMPWPVLGKMTGHDIRAIYEYLRAIPSLPDNHQ
jgi:hypothetical protein